MKIEHLAIWTDNIEKLKAFYETYFEARSNQKYINKNTMFESYFLSFSEGCRIEIMQKPSVQDKHEDESKNYKGLTHLAISVGSEAKVLSLTNRLRKDGYNILSEPRVTGDGYFESVIGDPDGNRIEITV
jgi:lactoylglutathione lyase